MFSVFSPPSVASVSCSSLNFSQLLSGSPDVAPCSRPLALPRQNGPTTGDGAAVARVPLFHRRGVPLLEHEGVVVHELLAHLDVVKGFDPESLIVHDHIAVGCAGVVEEACFVAVHRRVHHHVVVDGEQKGVMPLPGLVGVARLGFGGGESLPGILEDASAGGYGAHREGAHPLDGALAHLEGKSVGDIHAGISPRRPRLCYLS